MFFMPKNPDENSYCQKIIIKYLEKFGLEVLYIREVPVDSSVLGNSIKGNEPSIKQIFIKQKSKQKRLMSLSPNCFLLEDIWKLS